MSPCNSCGVDHAGDEPLCASCAAEVSAQAGVASVAGFRLLRQLGAGRYGTSWLGYIPEGVVVVKILSARAATAEGANRFLAECATASQLSGPTIARLLTSGQLPDGRLFLVYEYGGDQSLADVLRAQARLSPPRALDVCAELCDALEIAHAQGIVHRDLKAANIGLWQDEDGSELVRVLDFATWQVHTKAGLREPGPLPLSSAATASPEEARGEQVDRRADLYAVGVILFQSLTGRLPITGATAAELLKSHRDHPPLSLRDAGRKLPQLEDLVASLLYKRPHERPDTAAEIAVLLRELTWQVTDEANPRPARAPAPPAEPPLPAAAAAAPAHPPVAPAHAPAPRQTAALPHDAPTPPGGLDAEPPSVMDRVVMPVKRSVRDAKLDPDRTPPDPLLASVAELPKAPAWLEEEAQKKDAQRRVAPTVATPAVAKAAASARPVPPAPPRKPAPASATAATAELAAQPPRAPRGEQRTVEETPNHQVNPAEAPQAKAGGGGVGHGRAPLEQPTVLGGIDIPKPPPKILRRRRGENAAFSGPGRRRPLLQRQLVKYGVGLIVLLGLLVYGALHFSKDDAPRKRKPAASEHDAAAGARKAVADE